MFQLPENRTFVIAEIGINHNGSLEIAKKLIDVAVEAGCDAVKFQKRTPAACLPPELWNVERDTPWGERMTYLRYREKIELSSKEYFEIDSYCRDRGILWFASAWDCNAANTLDHIDIPLFKIPSACVTNLKLVEHIASLERPVIMSTGMSSFREISEAVMILRNAVPWFGLLVCTSMYPAQVNELHLARLETLAYEVPDCIVGYSGHEPGLWTTLCAVAMGARIVERHITLDRSMPGTDQSASVEPPGLKKLVKEIRNFEVARGSGEIRLLDCERDTAKRLRGYQPCL